MRDRLIDRIRDTLSENILTTIKSNDKFHNTLEGIRFHFIIFFLLFLPYFYFQKRFFFTNFFIFKRQKLFNILFITT
jgi:hypothetical protein